MIRHFLSFLIIFVLLLSIPFSTALELQNIYHQNNPYKYVDPSGESPLLVIAGVVGLIGGGISAYLTYKQTGSWQKAAISGAIGFAGTAASVALIGITGTSAVAGGALRVAAPTLAEKGLEVAGLATIGAGQSIAEQTLVQGRTYSELSGTDIAVSASANALLPSLTNRLPGVIQRTPGEFFPSTYSPALGREIGSQSMETLYSETSTRILQSNIPNTGGSTMPQTSSTSQNQNRVSQAQTSRSNAFTRFFNRIRSRFRGNK